MKKYANSNNATCIKLNCKPGEPIITPANEPDAVRLNKIRTKAEATPYGADFTATRPAEKPPTPQVKANEKISEYPDEDRPIFSGTHNPYRYLRSRIQDMLKSCKDRDVEFDIEGAALQLNTSEDRIAEVLDEVTR